MARIVFGMLLAWGLVLSWSAARADEDCDASEVKVYEDDKKIICRDRKEYSACVRKAGEALRDEDPHCYSATSACFKSHEIDLKFAGAACVTGCIAGKLTAAVCLATCGPGVYFGLSVYEACADALSTCQGQRLAKHRKAVQACGNQ